MAVILVNDGDEQTARSMMTASALGGNIGAKYQLGLFLANGIGGEVEPEAAVAEFQMAAEAGDVRAMYQLGRCYEAGFGVEASSTEARRWMKKAAGLGNADAKEWCQKRDLEFPSTDDT